MLFIDAENAGISGDMLIAALLNMGASVDVIDKTLSPISEVIGKYDVKTKKVKRGPYMATSYRFNFEDREISYADAKEAIRNAGLSEKAKDFALKCFETLTDAEAKVHGVKKNDLHLHDVPDTISDFTVASALLDDLGILDTKVISSPVNTGKGFFKFHNQRSTLPAPATTEILKGKPIFGDADMELTTPTGATLLVNLADDFIDVFPSIKVNRIGYGAGYKDMDFPNVLKLYHGVGVTGGLLKETIVLLETNVDTSTGETLGYLFEQLFDEGALDVTIVPCIMKKNRPGQVVKVMCRKEDAEKLTRIIMEETGSLGVRILPEVHRHVLERSLLEKKIKIKDKEFSVRIKTAKNDEGNIMIEKVEFEDLKRIATDTGLSLREVEKRIGK
jgi:uncharacterized protein (TIGR00299 family) protein